MSQLERQQKIVALLKEHPSLTIREIVNRLFYSEASVRRDIRELESRHIVTHLYGAVTLANNRNSIVPLPLREDENGRAKEIIAQKAAELVRDGDTIIMDSSSTVRRMIQYLGEKKHLRIITNNQKIFGMEVPNSFRLYCTGGTYNPDNHNFCGTTAIEYIKNVKADALFFSSQGLSLDGEISDTSEEETDLRKAMIKRAKKKYFLCDSSKLGVERQFILCHLSDLDQIICDNEEKLSAFL